MQSCIASINNALHGTTGATHGWAHEVDVEGSVTDENGLAHIERHLTGETVAKDGEDGEREVGKVRADRAGERVGT